MFDIFNDVFLSFFQQNIFQQFLVIGVLLFGFRVLLFSLGSVLFDHPEEIVHDHPLFDDYVFSIQTLTAFVLGFGLGGSAAVPVHDSIIVQSLAATAGGCLVVWLQFLLLRFLRGFVSTGTQFLITKTIGLTAEVYVGIPHAGRGKVLVMLDNVVRELDAVSVDGAALESMSRVQIISADPSGCVVVRRI